MDSSALTKHISDSAGIDKKTTETLIEALTSVIAETACAGDTVAVPSFGSFVPVKLDEEIKTDLSSGKRVLFPPQVVLEFNPAASLRKKTSESNG